MAPTPTSVVPLTTHPLPCSPIKSSLLSLPINRLGSDKPLDIVAELDRADAEQPWYHGDMSADAAWSRLSQPDLVDGTFLIRTRQRLPGGYCISLCISNTVHHIPLTHRVDGLHMESKAQKVFKTLRHLVEHFSAAAPVVGGGSGENKA